MSAFDLPFEPSSGDLHDSADAAYAGGVVIMAAHIDVPGQGPTPALVFRFRDIAVDVFLPPIVLVLDDERMGKLRPLANEAIHAAREGAKAAARGAS